MAAEAATAQAASDSAVAGMMEMATQFVEAADWALAATERAAAAAMAMAVAVAVAVAKRAKEEEEEEKDCSPHRLLLELCSHNG